MSQYLRQSVSVDYGDVQATFHFGEERQAGRCTITVLNNCPKARRDWKRACERLGVTANPISQIGEGTQFAWKVVYSCKGELTALAELVTLRWVTDWNDCEARIPRRMNWEQGGKPEPKCDKAPPANPMIPCPEPEARKRSLVIAKMANLG